jgi:hypothetical protein
MFDLILPPILILFAVLFILFSKSSANYQKLADKYGENFAKNVNKQLNVCGYLLLACSGIWLAIHFFGY